MRIDQHIGGFIGEIAPHHRIHENRNAPLVTRLVHEALEVGIEGGARIGVTVGLVFLVVMAELDNDKIARFDLADYPVPPAFVDERERRASVDGMVVDADVIGEELMEHHSPPSLLLTSHGVLIGHGGVTNHEDGGLTGSRGSEYRDQKRKSKKFRNSFHE